jgi:hypothetical protein
VRRLFALTPGKGLQDFAHGGAIEPRLASVHPFDSLQNELGWLGFMDHASRARNNSTFPGSWITKAGKDEYRRLARQVRQKIEAAFFAKIEFEQHNVRPVLLHGRQRFAVTGG